uniref:BRCT domain-containing protein n=1 Tax=Kalanchoe fedtschenkoi TaxID=63787 RepID=A0A7N0U2N0_KALFE
MLCPLHASSKLPCEMSVSERKRNRAGEMKSMQESTVTADSPKIDWKGDSNRSIDKIVLCYSAITDCDKDIVSQFKMLSGVKESKKWSSSVTHVIASVDENEACRRTLKILMGILEGKWILSVKWIKACIDAKRLVDEEKYEITVDIHGIKDGPRLGRVRVLNKEPKLFHGLEFYFFGEFATTYKRYLQDLITAGGGIILHRKPFVADQSRPSTFIIYNLELPVKHDPSQKDMLLNKRISEANALANSTGAVAASNTWIINSVAACQLQIIEE